MRVMSGQWHERRPQILANGLIAAREAAPHLQRLAEHMLPFAPRRPLASQTIRSITRMQYADPALLPVAITLPWISFDTERIRNIVATDIDHADGAERAAMLADLGLPSPTLVVDPWSGHSHGFVRLSSPVYTGDGAKLEPQRLFGFAGGLLAAAMGATLLPRRALIKNPWALQETLIGTLRRRGHVPATPLLWEAHIAAETGLLWHTEPGDLRPVELREIVAALVDDYGEGTESPAARQWCRKRPEPDSRGRNCALFDLVRFWAYDRIERDAGAIHDYATRLNTDTFADTLPNNEVAATARSIAKFMQTRYRPRRGEDTAARRDDIAGGDACMTPRQKRTLSGVATAADRAARTDAAIASAQAKLLAEGSPVTQSAISAAAGISRWTLKRRQVQVEQAHPWETEGVSRATWYRRHSATTP